MKKTLNWMLMAAVVLGLSMSIASCKDDDNDKGNKEEQLAADNDLDNTAWRWLTKLAGLQEMPDNWEKNTYEPTVGNASENNALTRIVIVNDLDEARRKFADLTDAGIDEIGENYTVNDKGIGTMTWTVTGNDVPNLAEVTVNTKFIPHLQKIVYCTEEQTGENGLFSTKVKGTCYYRIGDVIQDSEGYYWVCVCSSFQQHNKVESHWMNIFNASESGNYNGKKVPIPEKNICADWNNKEKYDNKTLMLPTKLSYSREHMFNLCNIFFALKDPDNYIYWSDKYNKIGLGGFSNFYHGKQFIENLKFFWAKHHIWEKLFSYPEEEMMNFSTINLLYRGYSWKWLTTNPTVFIYSSSGYSTELFGSVSKDENVYEWKNGFDVRLAANDPDADQSAKPNKIWGSGDNQKGMWVVRYKTGDDLCTSGKYDRYKPIKGCTEVYCYNKEKNIKVGEETSPETENNFVPFEIPHLDKPTVGCVLCSNGLFYKNLSVAKSSGFKPVATVVCLNGKNYVDEDNRQYNGLAIALDAKEVKWAGGLYEHCSPKSIRSWSDKDLVNYLGGIQGTKLLAEGCKGQGHVHPAAKLCADGFDYLLSPEIRKEKGFSEWFMPDVGQWILAMTSLGLTYKYNSYFTIANRDVLEDLGLKQYYWCTTPYEDKEHAKAEYQEKWVATFHMSLLNEHALTEVKFIEWQKHSEYDDMAYLCPFIAFKYEE